MLGHKPDMPKTRELLFTGPIEQQERNQKLFSRFMCGFGSLLYSAVAAPGLTLISPSAKFLIQYAATKIHKPLDTSEAVMAGCTLGVETLALTGFGGCLWGCLTGKNLFKLAGNGTINRHESDPKTPRHKAFVQPPDTLDM